MPRRFQPPHTSPGGATFRHRVVRDGDSARVLAGGELDIAAVAGLAAEVAKLRQAGCRRLIFDLRELSFIDSSGLAFLVDCFADADHDGYTIALIPGPPAVQRLFGLAGAASRLR